MSDTTENRYMSVRQLMNQMGVTAKPETADPVHRPIRGVSIETVHRAHIDITYANHYEYTMCDPVNDELNAFVRSELAKYSSGVSEDPDFRCNALTEIGLIGSDIAKVTEVANAIADYAMNHPHLDIVDKN